MPKKTQQRNPKRASSGQATVEIERAVERLPTDEIFDGLRDRTLSRKAAIKRLLELDCVDVLQFLDLSWVHTVANTGRAEFIGKKTNFAFDIRGLSLEEVALFRDWLTGTIGDDDVTVELLAKLVSISANALKVWISDKRVDSLV
jgi:hypothetical protein